MNVILLGEPGLHKKEVANLIRKELGLNFFSTSNIISELMKNQNHKFHSIIMKNYDPFMNLVSNEMVYKFIDSFAEKPIGDTLFSGFPKTVEQSDYLDKLLMKQRNHINHVFYLHTNQSTLIKKLYGRVVNQENGHVLRNMDEASQIYPHSSFLTKDDDIQFTNDIKKQINKLDKLEDSEEIRNLQERKSDYIKYLSHKIEMHELRTKPVLDYYHKRNKLIPIQLIGNESTEHIVNKILSHIIDIDE